MKKTKTFALLFSAMLIGGSTLASTGMAHAADTTPTPETVHKAGTVGADGKWTDDTNAAIKTNSNVASTDTTGTSTGAVQFYAGMLKLLRVPNLDYGAHVVNAAETYPLAEGYTPTTDKGDGTGTFKNPAADTDRILEVQDQTGSAKGWNVSASMTPFTNSADATKKMTYTSLTFDNGEYWYATGAQGLLTSAASGTSAGNTKPSGGLSGTLTMNTDKTNGDKVVVWNANAGTGAGTWAAALQNTSDSHLTVPQEQQQIGTWTATLNWTLASGPATTPAP